MRWRRSRRRSSTAHAAASVFITVTPPPRAINTNPGDSPSSNRRTPRRDLYLWFSLRGPEAFAGARPRAVAAADVAAAIEIDGIT